MKNIPNSNTIPSNSNITVLQKQRKCFLIDTLLEQRQKRLEAASNKKSNEVKWNLYFDFLPVINVQAGIVNKKLQRKAPIQGCRFLEILRISETEPKNRTEKSSVYGLARSRTDNPTPIFSINDRKASFSSVTRKLKIQKIYHAYLWHLSTKYNLK